ncbi:hypothetical protein DL96DRAFT_482466 [Flagelloscypha sp. PMI_526]|nr:hypothetical protein DL96DRAFT_482466 [Flagelloscypha sp. PMI_526]
MAMIFALTTLHIHIAEHGFPETVPERNYLELSENFAASALRDNPADYDVNMYDTKDPVCIINSLFSLVSLSHPNFQLASFSPGPMIDPAYIYPDHPFSWLAASRYSQTKAMEHWNPYFKKERPIVIPAGPVSLEIHVNNICYDNLLPFPELLTFIHTSGAPDPMELAADGQVSRVYEEAVRHLKLLWNVSYQKYSEQFKLMLWPYAMSQTFYELVMAKQPRALVIFAHYCALLGQFQDKWILRNRGKS